MQTAYEVYNDFFFHKNLSQLELYFWTQISRWYYLQCTMMCVFVNKKTQVS